MVTIYAMFFCWSVAGMQPMPCEFKAGPYATLSACEADRIAWSGGSPSLLAWHKCKSRRTYPWADADHH